MKKSYKNRKTNVEAPCIKTDTLQSYSDLFILHLESQSVSAASKTSTVRQ